MRGESGFILFELLMVMVIVAIVAAISIPTLTNVLEISSLNAAARFIKGDMMGTSKNPIFRGSRFLEVPDE